MTSFAAYSIGPLLNLSNIEGMVSGVYNQTLNIQLLDRSLITCAMSNYFGMPRGIICKTPDDFRFNKKLQGGEKVYCRGGIVRFAERKLKIDLRCASVWTPELEPNSPPSEILLANLLENTNSEFLDFDPEISVRNFIGRGPGLTPEGDDFLVGLLAAPMLVAPSHPFGRTMAAEVTKYVPLTNDISRQMLSDATLGYFIKPIIDVMAALYGNGDIESAMRKLNSVGSSSGAAMTLGVVMGVARVENHSLNMTPNQIRAA